MEGFEELGEFLAIVFIIYFAVLIVALAVKIASRWVFFNKCKEQGWKSLIPVYNDITIIKIAGMNWWWILLLYSYSIFSIVYGVGIIGMAINGNYSDTSAIFSGIQIVNSLLSLVFLFVKFNISYNLAKKFDESIGYAFLIMFFEPIMFFVLGLSKSYTYNESAEVSPNGVFGANNTTTSSSSVEYCGNCGAKANTNAVYCKECGFKMR